VHRPYSILITLIYYQNKTQRSLLILYKISDGRSCKSDRFFIRVRYVREKNPKKDYEKMPEIINLNDEEAFIGPNNRKLNIKAVGVRTAKGIYFKLDDISVEFEMPGLSNNVTRKDRDGYTEGIHYKIFSRVNKSVGKKVGSNEGEMYLTFRGVMRALFTTKSILAETYILWVTETLFTVQFGNVDDKNKLAEKISGITAETLKELGKTNVTTMPCVYLFSIGEVKNLRDSMGLADKYKDTDKVYKLGYTNDLPRRAKEHDKDYGKIKGAQLKLEYHAYIDVRYVAEVEAIIKEMFKDLGLGIEYEKYSELSIVPIKQMKSVKKQYNMMGSLYMGNVKELLAKMEDMKNKNITQLLEKDIIIAQKDTIIAQKNGALSDKNVLVAQSETALSRKDNEIMRLEYMLEKAGIVV
jgi:hypothetical protein